MYVLLHVSCSIVECFAYCSNIATTHISLTGRTESLESESVDLIIKEYHIIVHQKFVSQIANRMELFE